MVLAFLLLYYITRRETVLFCELDHTPFSLVSLVYLLQWLCKKIVFNITKTCPCNIQIFFICKKKINKKFLLKTQIVGTR